MKKKALFIGNCQNGGLIHYLVKSEEFRETYDIKSYANWEMIENGDSIPTQDLKSADLFVYQPLPPVHGCYSTDPEVENSIGYYVKKDCIKISYPYVYSSAFWPLVRASAGGDRWFGNEVIDDLVSKGFSLNDILGLYDAGSIDWMYEDRFNETLSILKDKERFTDIKISDYLVENIKTSLLFLIPQHPTSLVLFELSNRILEKMGIDRLGPENVLGINDALLFDTTYGRPSKMFPMHKSVIDHYSLEYADQYIEDSHTFFSNNIRDYYSFRY